MLTFSQLFTAALILLSAWDVQGYSRECWIDGVNDWQGVPALQVTCVEDSGKV